MIDRELNNKIDDLKKKILSWGKKKKLVNSFSFRSYIEHFDSEPEWNPCVLVMCIQDEIANDFNGYSDYELYDSFSLLFGEDEFYWEMHDSVTLTFHAKQDDLIAKYKDFFEWQWICALIKPDYSDLYEEVFNWFTKKPEYFYHLKPREFEIMLYEIFRNNGYEFVQLGKGWDDGGVDLTLLCKDEIGDITTLVQAKRSKNPIRLDAVAALSGHIYDRDAQRGIFVTTSRYLPGVEAFAGRQKREIKLAASKELSNWSGEVANKIVKDKSTLISDKYLSNLLLVNNIDSLCASRKIAVSTSFIRGVSNTFYLILKETKNAALLMEIPSEILSHDGFGQKGIQIPLIGKEILRYKNEENVFRAIKLKKEGEKSYFWGKINLIGYWDGKPMNFDYYD